MPHNLTRIWAGLAIAAITIPAVGEFYVHSEDSSLAGSTLLTRARLPSEGSDVSPAAAGPLARFEHRRDYLGEVDAALAKRENDPMPFAGSDDDPTFDVSPYADDEAATDDAAKEPSVEGTNGPTLPAVTLVSDSPVSLEADSGQADLPTPIVSDLSNEPVDGGASDATVYATIVNNLPAERREKFVRTFSSLAPDRKDDLLNEGRAQMQGGGQ